MEQYLEDLYCILNDKHCISFLPYDFQTVDKDKIIVEQFKLPLNTDDDDVKQFVKHRRDFFVIEKEDNVSKYFWRLLVDT